MHAFGTLETSQEFSQVLASYKIHIASKAGEQELQARVVQPDESVGVPSLELPDLIVSLVQHELEQDDFDVTVVDDRLEVLVYYLEAKADGTDNLAPDRRITLQVASQEPLIDCRIG